MHPARQFPAQALQSQDVEQTIAGNVVDEIIGRRAVGPAGLACRVDRDGLDEGVPRLGGLVVGLVLDRDSAAGPPVDKDAVDAPPLSLLCGRADIVFGGEPAVEELRASLASGFPGIETSSHGWPSLVIR